MITKNRTVLRLWCLVAVAAIVLASAQGRAAVTAPVTLAINVSDVQVEAIDTQLLASGVSASQATREGYVQRVVNDHLRVMVAEIESGSPAKRAQAIKALPDRAARCKQAEAALGLPIPGCGR